MPVDPSANAGYLVAATWIGGWVVHQTAARSEDHPGDRPRQRGPGGRGEQLHAGGARLTAPGEFTGHLLLRRGQ